MTAPWPMDKVAKLLECAAQGMSAGQIGALLGMTRNAIIGKAARIKLQLLGRSGNNMKPPKKPRKSPQMGRAFYAPQEPLPPTDAPRAIPPAPNSKPVDLMGLTNATCRWPLWETDRDPHLFCGALEADNVNGIPYCPVHRKWAV